MEALDLSVTWKGQIFILTNHVNSHPTGKYITHPVALFSAPCAYFYSAEYPVSSVDPMMVIFDVFLEILAKKYGALIWEALYFHLHFQ